MEVNELCGKLSTVLKMDLAKKDSDNDYFNAAVLIPLIWDNNQLSVLFEVRSSHLSWQPGEICFPGGRIEATDKNSVDAAVRETSEELDLKIDQIQVLGSLHEIVSPIGVRLYPSVGYISDVQDIKASPDEVAEVFSVPLAFLLANEPIVGHMERCTRPLSDFPFHLLPGYSEKWKSRKNYRVLFYQYKQYVIWGLTAQVLYDFLLVCKKIVIPSDCHI
ncbi:NUDIX hydrolase [Pelosinus sp. sgz500959]|uniref:NUDIX hydrolase n=1 Tax=Pelosinus sp. sgz500959 TaxID=3242472 RepID=UPI00366EF62A